MGETEICKEVGGGDRDSGVIGGCGGAVRESPSDALCVHGFRLGSGGKTAFHREGICVEPV